MNIAIVDDDPKDQKRLCDSSGCDYDSRDFCMRGICSKKSNVWRTTAYTGTKKKTENHKD